MKLILTSILLTFLTLTTVAQDYYWVGGTGNWSDLSHWATTSGGNIVHTELPAAGNNVYFDANSFSSSSQLVTLDVVANCKNMDWAGATNFPTISGNGNDINIYGSLVLSPDMTANFSDVEFESTGAGNTITTNGTSLGTSSITRFNGNGGEWALQDVFTTNSIFILAGTFTTNNNTINAGNFFQTSGSLTKVLNLGSSVITTERWWIFGTNQTINTGTSKIIVALFYGDDAGDGPFTYYDVEFNSGGILKNNASFNEITTVAGETLTLQSGDVFTINNLVANGNKHSRVIIKSSTAGAQSTFSKSLGSINVDYVELADVHATGGASFTANNSTGNGNTTGWTINPVVEQDYYWVGNSGNWSDYPNHWATTSGGSTMHTDYPTKTDNVFFNVNSFSTTGQTVTLDLNAQTKDMDWTGVINAPTITGSFAFRLEVFGSATFTPEVVKNIWNFSLRGSGNHTITNSTNGAYLNFSIDGEGTYTLQDPLSAQSISLYKGIINTNNQTVTSSIDIAILGTAEGTTVNLGSSDIYARNFNLSNYSYQPTLNAGTSNLYLSGGIIVQSNTTSGFMFNNVHLSGSTILEGSNTFENLTLEPGANVSFEDDEVTTINSDLNLNGTKALPITLGSTVSGTVSTISKTSGTVNGTYLILQDMTATGGATFNATQTIDNGNNTGWIITPITDLDYYWVGNGGNWSDYAAHWATTSGGSTMHTTVPGVLDNVFFDANSFNTTGEVVVIDDLQANFNDLDASTVSNGFTLSGFSKEMNAYGSVNIPASVTVDVGTLNFLATGSETINFSGGPGNNTEANFLAGGNWTLGGDLLLYRLKMENGILNTNNYNVEVFFELRFAQSNPKTLNLGTSTVSVSSWQSGGATNITVNGSSSELIISSSFNQPSSGTNTINLNNFTFAKNSINNSTIYYDLSVNNFTITAGTTLRTSGISTVTANDFTLTGTSADPILIYPQTTGSSITFSKTSGVVDAHYLEMESVTATGGAIFNAYNSIDNGDVIGWIFHRNSQTINFGSLSNKAYGDPDFNISASASSGLPVSFSIISGPATISDSTITLTGVGTVEVKAEQAGNIDYDPAPSVTQSFDVAFATQTIDFTAITNKTFGDAPFELIATASSGLEISFSVVSGPVTISGNTVTITGAGTVEVMASQAGDATYAAATSVINSFDIAKADQTITFEALSGIVMGEVNSIELIASATSGLAIEFSVVGPATITGNTLTPTSVGTVTVTANQPGNAIYNAAPEVDQVFEIIDNITGLEDLRANNIKIYPQPAQNKLFIGQPSKTFGSIIIYDLNGMAILQQRSTNDLIEVNTTALPNGIYFMRLIGENKIYTTRIVIGK